jgi:shikimate kinase
VSDDGPVSVRLVVIIGPIGAGKSTVARLLAERLVAAGLTAATPDVDDVVVMGTGPAATFDEMWDRGRRVHGAVVGAWLRSGVDVVIAHGPAYTAEETAALMAEVPADTPTLRVLLLVPYVVALGRVTGDPLRGLSQDPLFLRETHERFADLLPTLAPCDHTFMTERLTADLIADALAADLLR